MRLFSFSLLSLFPIISTVLVMWLLGFSPRFFFISPDSKVGTRSVNQFSRGFG